MIRQTACFAGSRLEALIAFRRYANVTSIVTVPGSRVHQHCEASGIATHLAQRDRKDDTFHFLAEQSVQWVLSAGFPFIIPAFVLRSGPTFINSHPALLPAYKGYDAIKEAVRNGEEYMGVTVHYMVEKVDEGPPIYQEKVWVKGLVLQEIYDLMFGVVEPMAITRAMEYVLRQG